MPFGSALVFGFRGQSYPPVGQDARAQSFQWHATLAEWLFIFGNVFDICLADRSGGCYFERGRDLLLRIFGF